MRGTQGPSLTPVFVGMPIKPISSIMIPSRAASIRYPSSIFGEFIRKARLEKGFRQKDVAPLSAWSR